jgi:hypothetical protein
MWTSVNFLYYFGEFRRIILEKINNEEFKEIMQFGKKVLSEFVDFKDVEKLNIENSGDNILITEAINFAAKVNTGSFYMLKPAMIVASAKNGAKIGIDYDDGWDIYYLFDEKVGVASFHDPNGEVNNLLKYMNGNTKIKKWLFGWSGVYRQDMAFDLISKKERLFLQRMRYETLPGEKSKQKKDLIKFINKNYSID